MSESAQSATAAAELAKVCVEPTRCPICGGPNGCRMETGEAFKGPCWCAQVTVSAAALERLIGHVVERRCLCRSCLDQIAANPDITWDELRPG